MHRGAEMAIRLNPKNKNHSASNPRSKRASTRRLALIALLGASLVGSTGCTLISSSVTVAAKDVRSWVDDSMSNYRDRTLAEKAWIEIRDEHRNHQYRGELKKGFIAGYQAVANGGNGCTPPIAPSEYWGWKYQSPFGQAAVQAWFEGYPLGAKAAEIDGVGNWSRVQLNLREPQEFQGVGEPALSGEPSEINEVPPAPAPTVLEQTSADPVMIPSSSDLPALPSVAASDLPSIEPVKKSANTPGANEFNAFMNQASANAKEGGVTAPSGFELPPAVARGTVSMTGPNTGNGSVESPASYDDWLKNIRGEASESEAVIEEDGAIEFQFDSENSDLPFTIE